MMTRNSTLADVSVLKTHFAGLVDQDMPHLWVLGADATLDALQGLVELMAGSTATQQFARRQLSTFAKGDHAELASALTRHGSDKALHGYSRIYSHIFQLLGRSRPLRTLEIGLGTNRRGAVSNMGAGGRPGASLRAFRDFLPRAAVHGADVDAAILFEEVRKSTRAHNSFTPPPHLPRYVCTLFSLWLCVCVSLRVGQTRIRTREADQLHLASLMKLCIVGRGIEPCIELWDVFEECVSPPRVCKTTRLCSRRACGGRSGLWRAAV